MQEDISLTDTFYPDSSANPSLLLLFNSDCWDATNNILRLYVLSAYEIGICCFSTKHAALSSKCKDWFARNQNNVPEWSDMSTRGLLFQWASTTKIQLGVFV
jgi:hypothetical protein